MENEIGSEAPSLHDENVQLLETVVRYSSLKTRKQPETLLLFGLSGSGKTSMVNTIYNVLTGTTESALQAGSGRSQSKTLDFKWYVNCGIDRDNIINPKIQSKIGPIVDNLPNIIDCAGKGDVNDEQAKEILRHALTGRIPPGTSINALEEQQNQNGVGYLNVILPPCNPEWTVTKIIFVQSAAESIPENLLDMLHDVLSEHDIRLQKKFKASLFTVITKYDLVKDAERNLYGNMENATITAQNFQNKKEKLATTLRIKNNFDDNCIPWASYCDNVVHTTLMVPNSVWKLLKKIQFPKPVEHSGVPLPEITWFQWWRLIRYAFWNNSSRRTYVLIGLICIVIVAFLLLITQMRQYPNTSPTVTGEQTNSTGTQ